MAGNIKGITIEFSGDASKLDKTITQINKNTSKLDSELRQVNNALKFNPTSLDLWKQKQSLLNQKITETDQKLKALKAKQAQMDASDVDKNSEEYRKLQREIITTESRLKTFKGQLQSVGNVRLRVVSEQLKAIGSKATAAGNAMRGISRAAGVAAIAVGALAVKAGKSADDLNTLSKQYRLSTKDLQLYSAAANLVDVDVETIAKSHVRLTKSMKNAADGSEKQVEAFKQLGIEISDSNGELRDTDAVWQEVLGKLGSMKNETERDAIAMRLMGGAARDLNPLIEDAGETYKNVSETMKKYGLDFVDQKTLNKANDFNDKLDTMKAVGTLAFQTLGARLAGVLAPALEKVVEAVGKFAEWLSKLNPVIVAVMGGIAGLVALIAPALLIFGALASAAGAVAGALAGISAPVVAVVAAIAAVVAAIGLAYAKSAQFREAINSLVTSLASIFLPVLKSAISFFKSLFATIVQTASEIATDLAPVIAALTPVLIKVAKIIASTLKKAFVVLDRVIKVFAALVKSLVKIFATTFTTIASIATNAIGKIKNVFNKVKEFLTNPFEKAKDIIKGIIDKIKGFFNFSVKAPKIPMPHFGISPPGWKLGDLLEGKIPKLNIQWYAKGGIFDKPTLAGIGEAGPEAVVPLSGKQMEPFAKAISQNMGGIDYEKLSAAIVAAMMSVNTNVVLDVDGKRLADVTAPYMNNAINALQRRQDRKLGVVGV